MFLFKIITNPTSLRSGGLWGNQTKSQKPVHPQSREKSSNLAVAVKTRGVCSPSDRIKII